MKPTIKQMKEYYMVFDGYYDRRYRAGLCHPIRRGELLNHFIEGIQGAALYSLWTNDMQGLEMSILPNPKPGDYKVIWGMLIEGIEEKLGLAPNKPEDI